MNARARPFTTDIGSRYSACSRAANRTANAKLPAAREITMPYAGGRHRDHDVPPHCAERRSARRARSMSKINTTCLGRRLDRRPVAAANAGTGRYTILIEKIQDLVIQPIIKGESPIRRVHELHTVIEIATAP